MELLTRGLEREAVVMSPVVLAELFSDPSLGRRLQETFRALPMLDTNPGFWERSGRLRARLRERGYLPKLADTLIAQACIDYRIPFLTRDRDFQPFAKHSKLGLVLPT